MSAPRISIIICTRNRAAILGDCVRSLIDQQIEAPYAEISYEIVVIDDGSTDSTPQTVAQIADTQEHPRVRHVPQAHGGLNAARNNGVHSAEGEILVFLDDDEIAPPDYLMKVLARLEDAALDGAGGPCHDYGGDALPTCKNCSLTEVDVPGGGRRRVPRLLGGNMAVRASAFERVGPFDAEISGRGDDGEWFNRASGMGLQFEQDPELWVWHRRDHLKFGDLVRHAYVQGKSTPMFLERIGKRYQPSPMRVLRLFGHALRSRCVRGVVLGMRELGAGTTWLKGLLGMKTATGRGGADLP